MRRFKKGYKRPKIIWNKERIERDKQLKKEFGLVRKREIWKAETLLRKYRRLARSLAAKKDKKTEKELVEKLSKFGLVSSGAGLDDVLGLTVENILERRLQTVIFKRGLANTPKEARQMIVHGRVIIDGRKSSYPSYLVPRLEEDKIQIIGRRPTEKSSKKRDTEAGQGQSPTPPEPMPIPEPEPIPEEPQEGKEEKNEGEKSSG